MAAVASRKSAEAAEIARISEAYYKRKREEARRRAIKNARAKAKRK